ncbi:hypothetical protein L226DRAFT_535700 [Lentinus tigrinus ALCF2SS1-7]|uniref:uncharacterized protein n=1 Tax=Lentinus tigrinus ALCF2SS1-7 TaxID=1328758 RepID=UPI00116626E6|nr:hypothetical protein L226DRAFT_535700 [Lentinus tigrinus ALCF2SS1-7]
MLRILSTIRSVIVSKRIHALRYSVAGLPRCSRMHSHSASATDEITSKSHYVQANIKTLRPDNLTEADYIHLPTQQEYVFVWDALARSNTLQVSAKANRRPCATFRLGKSPSTFPAGLSGYLYYWTPSMPAPPTAGEIRFRRMFTPSPLSFNNGRDLLSSNGLPWRLQLPTIATFDLYQVYRDILLRDGLVSKETLAIAADMGRQRKAWGIEAQGLVYSFGQPWCIDLGSKVHWWQFMGERDLFKSVLLPNILSCKIGDQRIPSPWLGRALCTFTPDEHPRHSGDRVVNIKYHKVLELHPNPAFPEELRYVVREPKANTLLRRGAHPWQLHLDTCKPELREGFHVLFANARLPPLRTTRSLRSKPVPVGEREQHNVPSNARLLQPRTG